MLKAKIGAEDVYKGRPGRRFERSPAVHAIVRRIRTPAMLHLALGVQGDN